MKTDETSSPGTIALQPETQIEQEIVIELFEKFVGEVQAPQHPDKIGSSLVFYETDLEQFDQLNHELANSADISVDDDGKLSPEPGSRALVVHHDPETAENYWASSDSDDSEVVEDEDAQPGEEGAGILPTPLMEEMEEAIENPEPEYDNLQDIAKWLQENDVEIRANLSQEDFLLRFEEILEETEYYPIES